MTRTVSGWWHLVQYAQNTVHDGQVGRWLDPCADRFLKGAFTEAQADPLAHISTVL